MSVTAQTLISSPHQKAEAACLEEPAIGNIELQRAYNKIMNLDLSQVAYRLVKVEGYKEKEVEQVIVQYRRYLFLRKKYPNMCMPPSDDIDQAWHAHILYTQDYHKLCNDVFYDRKDSFLHHQPTERIWHEEFKDTQKLYKQEFGEYLYQTLGRSIVAKLLDKLRDKIIKKYPQLLDDII